MKENRLTHLFRSNPSGVLAIYMTPGYPELSDSWPVLKAAQEAGADIVEVGIPYSDPIADGPTIQQSSMRALSNGITLSNVFNLLKAHRSETRVPIVLMGYLNPIMQYGIERFCQDCTEAGVDGVILPDLPLSYYDRYAKDHFENYGIHPIYLITPATSDERIRLIDQRSRAFIYAVSSASTTGGKDKSGVNIQFLERLKSLDLLNPVLVGFNVKSRADHERISQYVQGSIIGSAFIRALNSENNPAVSAGQFVSSIK